jgi:excisionase family DNA binding protein
MTLQKLEKMFNPSPDNPYEVFIEDLARRIAEKVNKAAAPSDKWMSVADAAKHFDVGETTIREMARENKIPHTYMRGRLIILVSEVRAEALRKQA